MIAYVIDDKSCANKYVGPAVYDLTLKSIYDDVSTVTLPGAGSMVEKGDLVYIGGYRGIVDGVEYNGDTAELSCVDIAELFSRMIFMADDNCADGIEQFIQRQIEKNYLYIDDMMYRRPYIKVNALTRTPSETLLPDDEGGLWSIKTFARKAMRCADIFIDYKFSKNTLIIDIARRDRKRHTVLLSMSDIEVIEESMQNSQTAKITTRESGGYEKDWYMLEDGSITHEYTAVGRVDGMWESLLISEGQDAEIEVINRFGENGYSHLIEFATTRDYEFGDMLVIRTKNGRVLRSYITSVRMVSGDARIIYRAGEARLMIDEKLNKRLGAGKW